MNKDSLFDALENIDDDMLEEVDALRERKNVKPNRLWMRYVSAAACACIILGGVFMVSRYEAPSRFGTEDTTESEDMSGQGFIHNYIRAEISLSYSGSTPRVTTEPKEVTAIFDIIELIENTEEAESSTIKGSHDDDESDSERNFTHPGTFPGTTGGASYTIVLVSLDGKEIRYTLVGNVLRAENTGKSYVLSREHYSSLAEVIKLK